MRRGGAEGQRARERKLQRLFRDPRSAKLIKKCNDFGAGGVSVAIGELADGLRIDLDAVPKKYDGLDGTELAISESQERMAVVLAPADVQEFLALAQGENLEATVVAEVTAEKRLRSCSGAAGRSATSAANSSIPTARPAVQVYGCRRKETGAPRAAFRRVLQHDRLCAALADKNICSKRRPERAALDSTIGAGTVLMPFGGKYQRPPRRRWRPKSPVLSGDTDDCSVFAYGYESGVGPRNPMRGVYRRVVDSLARLVAWRALRPRRVSDLSGVVRVRLRNRRSPGQADRSALLGALRRTKGLSASKSIGGKDP